MINSLKQLRINSLIYGLGGVVQRLSSLLLLPLFTSKLSTSDFGVASLISLTSIAVFSLIGLGTGNSLGIFFFEQKNNAKRHHLIWTNVLINSFVGLFCLLLFLHFSLFLTEAILGDKQYSYIFCMAILGSVLANSVEPILAYLRMEQKAWVYIATNILSTLIMITSSIYLVAFLNLGLTGYFLGIVLGQTTTFILAVIIGVFNIKFSINFLDIFGLVKVGFPSIFGLIAFLVIDYSDRYLIKIYTGLDALGIYSIGYSIGMVMNLLVSAFATAWPAFFQSFITKQNEAPRVFSKTFTLYVYFFSHLIILFFLFSKPLMQLLVDEKFITSYQVIGLVALAYVFKGCYLIFLPGIYFAKKLYWLSIIEWNAAGINLVLNFILIPKYGIIGASLATSFAYLTLPVFAFFISRKYLGVKYNWISIAKIIFLTISVASLVMLIFYKYDMVFFMNFLTGFTLFIFVTLITYRFIFNKALRKWLGVRFLRNG